jgi:hypothetical protein
MRTVARNSVEQRLVEGKQPVITIMVVGEVEVLIRFIDVPESGFSEWSEGRHGRRFLRRYGPVRLQTLLQCG